MARIHGFVAALLAALILVVPVKVVTAADASSAEIEQLKKDIEQLRRQLAGSSAAVHPERLRRREAQPLRQPAGAAREPWVSV